PTYIVGVNEKSADKLRETATLLSASIALDLSPEPNNFWRNLFFDNWTSALRADLRSAGILVVEKGLTDAEQRDKHHSILDLERRIGNPTEACAPTFIPARPAANESYRMAFKMDWVGLY